MKTIAIDQIMDEVNFCDGSLRDIHINRVELSDWDKMLRFTAENYSVSNPDNKNIPLNISEIIEMLKNDSLLMRINVTPEIAINCNFFISETSYDQIELDYDPKEVQTRAKFQKILEFVVGLGSTLNKKVLVTPENCADIVMLEYSPHDRKTFYFNDDREKFLIQNS